MEELDPESGPGERANLPHWVRKRDGSIAAFDLDKLTASLFAARQRVSRKNAALAAAELTQAVVHFLLDASDGKSPSTEDIAGVAGKILRQMGQGPTAAAYEDFRERRRLSRQRLRVLADRDVPQAADQKEAAEAPWEKSHWVAALESDELLDPQLARDVVASVETRVLALGIDLVSVTLVEELIEAELRERGIGRSRSRRRVLSVPLRQIEAYLDHSSDPGRWQVELSRELLGRYALAEVYSQDVVSLHEDGLLSLIDLGGVLEWTAVGASTEEIARVGVSPDEFISAFERWLVAIAHETSGIVAMDHLDAIASLAVGKEPEMEALGNRLVTTLRHAAAQTTATFCVHLRGQVCSALAARLAEGSLFAQSLHEREERLPALLASRFLGALADADDLGKRVILDLHLDPSMAEDEFRQHVAQWQRRLRRPAPVRFVFDRPNQTLSEGLPTRAGKRTGIVQAARLALDALVSRLAGSVDLESLIERASLVCDAAVRGAVQKREFLRRRRPESMTSIESADAGLVLIPSGSLALCQALTGRPPWEDEAAAALVGQFMGRLERRLAREGRDLRIPTRLVSAAPLLQPLGDADWVIDLASPPAAWKRRCQAIASMGGRTIAVCLSDGGRRWSSELGDLLFYVAQHTPFERVAMILPSDARQAPLFDGLDHRIA